LGKGKKQMKLLSVNMARAIWWGSLLDLNPKGIDLGRIITPILVNIYKFASFPSIQDIFNAAEGWKFKNGQFKINEENPILIDFTIFNDGMVAETHSSTDHSESFLEDVLNQFSQNFKFPNWKEVIKRKNYVSEFWVSMNITLELINPKLKSICKYLSDNIEEKDKIFQVGGISFWPDQTSKINPFPLMLERALAFPFSENRYFSRAPLTTKKHWEVLEKLESILMGV
jgi:hypothetical protein